jgi:hypothetical protein
VTEAEISVTDSPCFATHVGLDTPVDDTAVNDAPVDDARGSSKLATMPAR